MVMDGLQEGRLARFDAALCRVLAFVPQLERRESGTTEKVAGTAAASDFGIKDEMRVNFWVPLNRLLFSLKVALLKLLLKCCCVYLVFYCHDSFLSEKTLPFS